MRRRAAREAGRRARHGGPRRRPGPAWAGLGRLRAGPVHDGAVPTEGGGSRRPGLRLGRRGAAACFALTGAASLWRAAGSGPAGSGVLLPNATGMEPLAACGVGRSERARGASSFAWLHSHGLFIEWMAASNLLVLVGRRLLFLESFLPFAQLRSYLLSLCAVFR